MSQLTDFAENKVTDALWRGQALGAPATWYVGLFSAAPSDTGGGTVTPGLPLLRLLPHGLVRNRLDRQPLQAVRLARRATTQLLRSRRHLAHGLPLRIGGSSMRPLLEISGSGRR